MNNVDIIAANDTRIYPGYVDGSEEKRPTYHDNIETPSLSSAGAPRSSTMYYDDDQRMLVTGILIAIMVILSILLCYLVMPLFFEYLKAKIPVSEARKERRYQTIEGWLVSKRARSHCYTCTEVKEEGITTKPLSSSAKVVRTDDNDNSNEQVDSSDHQIAQPISVPLSPSHDTAETMDQELDAAYSGIKIETETVERECSICMERFEKDDIVSWSPTTTCLHVFHHECLKEWLLYHDNCPYCRITVLPVDKLTAVPPRNTGFSILPSALGLISIDKTRKQDLLNLARDRAQRVRTTYYCLEDGLVVLPRPPSESQKALRRFLSTRVKAADLVALRGSRAAKSDRGVIDIIPSTTSSCATDAGTTVPFAREVRPLRIQTLAV